MKLFYAFLWFLLVSNAVLAQESKDKKIFLDSLCKETTEDNYKYYRIIKNYYNENAIYRIEDYFKSGNLFMEGYTSNKDKLSKTGDYVYYHENGKKKSQYYYQNSLPIGKYYTWYDSENPESEGEYPKDINSQPLIYQYWDKQNNKTVIDGNGFIKDATSFYGDGNIKNGLKDGVWKSEFKNGKDKVTETYASGKFISGVRTDENNVETQYLELEKKPVPPKGIQDFYQFIGNKFNYTRASIKNKIKGKIILSFVVDATGKIVEPKIIQGLGYGLDEEAMRVVQDYENWIPGEQRGVKVRVLYQLPLTLPGKS